jgi:cholesterol transport system auxiliary component
MTHLSPARPGNLLLTALLLVMITGCGTLQPTRVAQPAFYSLDNAYSELQEFAHAPAAPSAPVPTLIVTPPRAASGFNSQRIVYLRQAHQLEYYAHSEWIDTPARMLAPLIATAVARSGAYRAVVLTPSAASGELRLDTEIVRLQHDLRSQPSAVRFTLRAIVVDNSSRQVLARSEFDVAVPVTSEDPYGSVVAANRAVQAVLEQLAIFCAKATKLWQPAATDH